MKSSLLPKLAVLAFAVLFIQLPTSDSLEVSSSSSKYARYLNLGVWRNQAYQQRRRQNDSRIVTQSLSPVVKSPSSNTTRELALQSDPEENHHHFSYIYTFGGNDVNARQIASVSRLDVSSGKWHSCRRMLTTRSFAGIAMLGNKAYIVGGKSNEKEMLDSVEVYDLTTETSSFVRAMPEPRRGVAAAELNGYIYVSGGIIKVFDSSTQSFALTSSVIRYDPQRDEWEKVKPMGIARRDHQLVAVGSRLYAFPQGTNDNVVETYDPVADEWTMVTSSRFDHGNYFGAAAVEGKIYVCSSRGCEVYDTETDMWTIIKEPMKNLYGVSLAFAKNKLWALGGSIGYGHWKGTPLLFSYDFNSGEWTKEQDMIMERAYQASVSDYRR